MATRPGLVGAKPDRGVSAPPQARRDTAWMEHAACKGEPADVADARFPEKGRPRIKDAIKTCGGCPVKGPCLDWAMATHQIGVWGGTTTSDRERIRRRRERKAS